MGHNLYQEVDIGGYVYSHSHQNVLVPLFYTGAQGTPSSLAFPAQLGDLEQVRRLSKGMFQRRLAKPLSQGIARGLNHMHENYVIHRDLKPQNVLIGTNDFGVLSPRIADFGWARSTRDAAGGASQPPSGHRGLTPGAVTPPWRPLEIELGLQ